MTALQRVAAALNLLMSAGSSGAFLEAFQQVTDFATYKGKYKVQAAPVAETAAATLSAADLLVGLITATHATGATIALTLDTGALMDDAFIAAGVGIDEGIEWSLINLSAAALDTVTVTASSGHTIVGNAIVTSAHASTVHTSSARFLTKKTATDTYVTYRIA